MLDLPHQSIEPIRKLATKCRNFVCVLPTGGGKTIIATKIIKFALEKNNPVIFIVERDVLIRQSVKKFNEYGFDCGVIQGKQLNYDKQIIVASAQTLYRQSTFPKHIKLVLIDEAHHASVSNAYYKDVVNYYLDKKVMVLGLTATPIAEEPLMFERCLVLAKNSELIELNKTHDFGIVEADIKTFPQWAINTNQKEKQFIQNQSDLLNNLEIRGNVIENYRKFCEGKPTLVFMPSIKDSKEYCKLFNDAGIPSEHIDKDTKPSERDKIFKQLATGDVVVFNVATLIEGFDLPVIQNILLLTLTKSLRKIIQMVGRGLRSSKGKEKATIMDFAGNYYLHGDYTRDMNWESMFYENQEEPASVKNKVKDAEVEIEPIQLDGMGSVSDIANLAPNLMLESVKGELSVTSQKPVLGKLAIKYKYFKYIAKIRKFKHNYAYARLASELGLTTKDKKLKTPKYFEIKQVIREVQKIACNTLIK